MKKINSYHIALAGVALLCVTSICFTSRLSSDESAITSEASMTEETLRVLSYDDIVTETTVITTTQKHFTTTARITTQKHFTTTSAPQTTTTETEETTTPAPETTVPVTTDVPVTTTAATTTTAVTTTTAATTTATTAAVRDYASEVAAMVNAQRKNAGLAELRYDASLCKLAQTRADEISISFSHTRPDGTSGLGIFAANGIKYKFAGENIAKGQKTPEQVMDSWNNSSGHYKNMMSSSYTAIGIGYNAESKCWVQLFMG